MLRLSNLTTIMSFLSEDLFPSLPPTERKSFPLSLSTPIRTAMLNLLLLPNLPSSLSKLPEFLKLAQSAVRAEEDIIVKMLGDTSADRSIQAWVDGVGLHYERKRRADILDRARVIAVTPADDRTAFRAEMTLVVEDKAVPVQVDEEPTAVNGKVAMEAPATSDANDGVAWDFEDDTSGQTDTSAADDWGLDDDIEPEPEPESEPEPVVEPPKPPESEPTPDTEEPAEEEDDPWGWNNDNDAEPEEAKDDSAWDDAWDEKPATRAPPPEPAPAISAPRQAKGLEKRFGSKSVPQSPALPPPSAPAPAPAPQPVPVVLKTPPAPPPPKPVQVTESYVVSGRTKDLLRLVEDILREGAELLSSGILKPTASGSPGSVIMQAAPMALELFRALVPVANATLLKQSAKEPMKFSNDCLYVGKELGRIVAGLSGVPRDKFDEGLERLRVLGDSWFEDAIVSGCSSIADTLMLDTDDCRRCHISV